MLECKVPGCGNPAFAVGACRKHYEQEKLATASPCSISGCTKKCYRGVFCATHYRLHQLSQRPACVVPLCGEPQKNLTSGLCTKHDFRSRKHGALDSTRTPDWGAREGHPLYQIWHWHKRKGAASMCEVWRKDFWKFAEDIGGTRPDGMTLRRQHSDKPLAPGNWFWKESSSTKDTAKYARDWRKRNPDLAKNADLKRTYGITLVEYEAMLDSQNGVCAICKGPERTKDKDGGPRRMPVDHCHETGKVRGLICTHCNRALGMFKDSEDVLAEALRYLQRSKTR